MNIRDDIFIEEHFTLRQEWEAALPPSLDTRSVIGGIRMEFDFINGQLADLPGYDQKLVQLSILISALETRLGLAEEIISLWPVQSTSVSPRCIP